MAGEQVEEHAAAHRRTLPKTLHERVAEHLSWSGGICHGVGVYKFASVARVPRQTGNANSHGKDSKARVGSTKQRQAFVEPPPPHTHIESRV